MADDTQRLEDDVFVLREALDNALNLADFLLCCLTKPGEYSHAFPSMSRETIERLRLVEPEHAVCVHSKTVEWCESCADRNARFARRAAIEARRG